MNFFEELILRLPVSVVVAATSAVVAFAVTQSLNIWWHRRLRRRLIEDMENYRKLHEGQAEVALVLSVLSDIRQSALSFLQQQGRGGISVFQVHQAEGFGPHAEVWTAYLERIKNEVRKIRELGVRRVLLFANIPVALAMFAGATLTNGPEVLVHHFIGGGYLPIGRLTIETVRL